MDKDVAWEPKLQSWTQQHLLRMLLLAVEREELADVVLTTTLACVSSKRLCLVYQLSWLKALHAKMAHFHGSLQWSSLKGKDVTFGEVLSQSPLVLCVFWAVACRIQSLDPLSVDALCFLVVISAQQKGKQLLSGMRRCQILFYSPDLRDCVCKQTHSENI